MPKTNQYGVRFDKDLLDHLENSGIKLTPQKALNLYEDFFKKEIEKNTSLLMPGNLIKIYKLINPLDGTVFYIGRTNFDLNKRLLAHISSSKSVTTTEHLNIRKNNIIKEITNSGKFPIIELIETIVAKSEQEFKGFHEKEIFWMAYYLNNDQPLTNKLSNAVKIVLESFKKESPSSQKVIGTLLQTSVETTAADCPKNLAELKAICPPNLTGIDKGTWIAENRVKYKI